MGFGNLESDAGLTALNCFLADKSYIDGCVFDPFRFTSCMRTFALIVAGGCLRRRTLSCTKLSPRLLRRLLFTLCVGIATSLPIAKATSRGVFLAFALCAAEHD